MCAHEPCMVGMVVGQRVRVWSQPHQIKVALLHTKLHGAYYFKDRYSRL